MNTNLKAFIRDIPDFPQQGIDFRDVSPLLGNPEAFRDVIKRFRLEWDGDIDAIAALDARGFLFGGALAFVLALPLVMLRKKGKLPGETIGIEYGLEYGTASLEVQMGTFAPGSRVLVIDDLLATGGTAAAAVTLVEQSGACVAGCAFVVELVALRGRRMLGDYRIQSLVAYGE